MEGLVISGLQLPITITIIIYKSFPLTFGEIVTKGEGKALINDVPKNI